MHDFFKNIAASNSWGFEYGRSDYQNLERDIEAGKIYLYVDPIITDSKFTDVGNETLSYSGKFMLLLSSDVDEEYEDKYNDYIKPLLTDGLQIFKDEVACSDYQITLFRVIEVINLFDQNFDGVLVSYNVTNED